MRIEATAGLVPHHPHHPPRRTTRPAAQFSDSDKREGRSRGALWTLGGAVYVPLELKTASVSATAYITTHASHSPTRACNRCFSPQ